LVDPQAVADGVVLVCHRHRSTGHEAGGDGGLALLVVGEGVEAQEVRVENKFPPAREPGPVYDSVHRVGVLRPVRKPDAAPRVVELRPTAFAGVVVDADHVAVFRLEFRFILQMRHNEAQEHAAFIARFSHPPEGRLVMLARAVRADAAHIAVVAVLEPRQKVHAQVLDAHIGVVPYVALHVLLGAGPVHLHPLEPRGVLPLVQDAFQRDVGPFDIHARVGGGLDDPQRVVVDAEFHSARLQVGGPPRVIVLPLAGVRGPVSVFVEPAVVAPSVDADHLVAVLLQVLVHPVNVGGPFVLGDVAVGGEAVLVRAPVQRRPVRFRLRRGQGASMEGVRGDYKDQGAEPRNQCFEGIHTPHVASRIGDFY